MSGSSLRSCLRAPGFTVAAVVSLALGVGANTAIFSVASALLLLLRLFAALALTLASIGTYGVVSCLVTQGTREMGIRLALGATPHAILSLVVRQGMAVSLAGVAVGLGLASALTRYLQSLLFGVAPTDPATFGGVAAGLAAVAFVACVLPARRAARVDPAVCLRSE